MIACDPEQELFKQFEIMPAKSMLSTMSLRIFGKIKQAKKAGLKHGVHEGEEKQLPAAFLVDKNGKVIFSKYAKNLADLPEPVDFLEMVSNI